MRSSNWLVCRALPGKDVMRRSLSVGGAVFESPGLPRVVNGADDGPILV